MAVTVNSIVTPQTPRAAFGNLATANLLYGTAPTTPLLLYTAGPNGGRITRLHAIPCETISTANQLQLFRSADAGATKYFADSAVMATYTMAQTTAAPKTDFGYSDDNPMVLGANEKVYMDQGQAKSVNYVIEGADY